MAASTRSRPSGLTRRVPLTTCDTVVTDTSASEVMQLVLVTQYFDTLKSIGEGDKTNTLFLSHSPATVGDVSKQITEAMLVAQRADNTR